MKALRVSTFDPTYNLALEEVLFDALTPGHPGWFFLWQNDPSIIIGRHQNTVEEINEAFIRDHDLYVVRRPSGGGAVYHDTGNVNFSCLTTTDKNSDTSFAHFLAPIVEALADLGIEAEFSSRNDITVQGRKISGSAQRKSGHRVLHHGTMLIDLDTGVLGRALAGNPDKYTSKGIASHKSRVANLREFMPEDWNREQCLEAVVAAMARRCADGETSLTPEQDRAATALADAKYRTWDWNYGKSPEFTERRRKRFPFGAVECRLNVKDGKIRACRLFGDFFSLGDITALEASFTGIAPTPAALRAALSTVPVEQWFMGGDREALLQFFCEGDFADSSI